MDDAMYLTLRDAVAETMNDGERPQWKDSEGHPEESRLELLLGYLNHIKITRRTDILDDSSIGQNEMVESWTRAGFTRGEAMDLLKNSMAMAAVARVLLR